MLAWGKRDTTRGNAGLSTQDITAVFDFRGGINRVINVPRTRFIESIPGCMQAFIDKRSFEKDFEHSHLNFKGYDRIDLSISKTNPAYRCMVALTESIFYLWH